MAHCAGAARSAATARDATLIDEREHEARQLSTLGWSSHFGDQVEDAEADLVPVRIAHIHRDRLGGQSVAGPTDLVLPPNSSSGVYAVGDFVLVEPHSHLVRRVLERRSLLSRRMDDGRTQLLGANIDTLFIVTSCNGDFSVPRLERYLALAKQASIAPVLILTKADTAEDSARYAREAGTLDPDMPVIVVDPRHADTPATLQPWFGPGKTVALIGSSGVGKSTLVNSLAASSSTVQQTGATRKDAAGRHTTTARSLHPVKGGGWVLDSPGIRSLHIDASTEDLGVVFAEVTALATDCKFRDCTHTHEPGCAVRAALERGEIDPDRFARWRKLSAESAAAARPRYSRN